MSYEYIIYIYMYVYVYIYEFRLGISSDFISGFCGESDEEHADNLSLIRTVGFDQAFTYRSAAHQYTLILFIIFMKTCKYHCCSNVLLYSYSKREQTYAGLFMQDDVPEEVKGKRLTEVISAFYDTVYERNKRLEVRILSISINSTCLILYV